MAKQDTLNELIEDSYYTVKETLNVIADGNIRDNEEIIIARLERAVRMLKQAMDLNDYDDKHSTRITKRDIEIAD